MNYRVVAAASMIIALAPPAFAWSLYSDLTDDWHYLQKVWRSVPGLVIVFLIAYLLPSVAAIFHGAWSFFRKRTAVHTV